MGQAFRRASGRIGSSRADTKSQLAKPVEQRPPPPPPLPVDKLPADDVTPASEDASSRVNVENVSEERDPQYDAMLSQMVGRIQSKAGGKLEMGEASVVDKYRRPLPKVRNTTPESGGYEERPAPPGTLNVSQIRQVILLHQGKSDEHNGAMSVAQIAQRFRLDAAQVENIIQFVTLPPEDASKKNNNQE
ncbi:hypothetical protein ABFS82_14G009200 [Erythranthe guttata]|uniref:Uncharacterized protein n=1 Tax=Erythranthe guttata TaxID=4155 RepID=A0A022S0X0_ERYGU|nr:PREDICTED: uncharacterized protein LOC105961196 isoform X1 [Erythranthe guttata]EYU45558.1 hypothetical protein MIMGU_mgv1a014463mg [Erythranthe guttata]|eukprot:XP_012840894.1 PREDICTED: uncharacterized protein LOC105961196 isoform X1 [Erythranthe guttata]